MGWRTVIVNKNCKLSYKNDYLIIRSEELQMIHLSEINTIIVETGMVSIASYLINELAKQKIKLIFCDEKHNPSCEIMPYYGSFNTSKKILNQVNWNKEKKEKAWQQIVKYKIHNQAMLLKKVNISGHEKLIEYEEQVEPADKTNREGHAARFYFEGAFGENFVRGSESGKNGYLNYGYAILLSAFNRALCAQGYNTRLGIWHKNEYNDYNLSCDLMEPFRPYVDRIVFELESNDKDFKKKLVDSLNKKTTINGQVTTLENAISIYARSVINALNDGEPSGVVFADGYEL